MAVYRRGNKLWVSFRDARGKRQWQSTGLIVGQESEANKLLRALKARIAAEAKLEVVSESDTVAAFAEVWLNGRTRLADVANDRTRVHRYVLPEIGSMAIAAVRPKHILEVIQTVQRTTTLAQRTVYNIYSNMKAMFRDAQFQQLIASNPCILTSKQLGPCEDKDPEWRATAVYTRGEIERLIASPTVPHDRQVLYALQALAGLRHGEAAGLRWRHYDRTCVPLGKLVIAHSYNSRTKTRQTRYVPVHSVLAAMLSEWKLFGWQAMMQCQPNPDDLIVPMPPREAARRRSPKDLEGMRERTYSGKRFRNSDLPGLGLRHRRMHDLRRTFISLAQIDGARKELLKVVTHSPDGREAIDLYTTFSWTALCDEVAKLNIVRQKHGQLLQLRSVQAAETTTSSVTVCDSDQSTDENHGGLRVEAPGVEGGECA